MRNISYYKISLKYVSWANSDETLTAHFHAFLHQCDHKTSGFNATQWLCADFLLIFTSPLFWDLTDEKSQYYLDLLQRRCLLGGLSALHCVSTLGTEGRYLCQDVRSGMLLYIRKRWRLEKTVSQQLFWEILDDIFFLLYPRHLPTGWGFSPGDRHGWSEVNVLYRCCGHE